MINEFASFADLLAQMGQTTDTLQVTLSNELVHLLSDQLYQSASKAIEELVVNAYDADATECRVFIPEFISTQKYVVVYDNGIGMDREGLQDLWHIGRSNKRTEEIERRAKRKQIGKFGIGKLATYAIANKVTYLTRKGKNFLMVTLDFRQFVSDSSGGNKPVQLYVKEIADWNSLEKESSFREICALSQVNREALFTEAVPSWTFVVLEDLKDKANAIHLGRLQWILSTAMPLTSDFHLFLNGTEIVSSKSAYKPLVKFSVTELPNHRIQALIKATEENWEIQDNLLYSQSFHSGISGDVLVTNESLFAGKSADIGRSHGFFIRVRDRLVNEDDALFGMRALTFDTFYRFRADLKVDDLDNTITASREGVGVSEQKAKLQRLLSELFYEAHARRERMLQEEEKAEQWKRESERSYVNRRLVEYPIADVLVSQVPDQGGAEADESWFYLNIDPETNVKELVNSLYTQPRHKYTYAYIEGGASGRLVQFNPNNSTFYINTDHDLVRAHADNGRAKVLLEDFVTAEALLEVYLRANDVPPHTIGSVLELRDSLLRGLAEDHPFSLDAISNSLRNSADNAHDLEVVLVTAVRALGFVATHISGAGEPDGIARFTEYPGGEQKITLEAKSSIKVPALPQLDFGGLREHVDRYSAQGCLLVAPSYPGRDNDSAVSVRAVKARISCWTIDQLASVVAVAEARHFTAHHILDIVLRHFAPEDVTNAVKQLFQEPNWEVRDLYNAVLNALEQLENRLIDSPRTLDLIAGEISRDDRFRNIKLSDVDKALRDLAHASQGLLVLRDKTVYINGAYAEIERRLDGLTGHSGEPRKTSTFRNGFNPPK